MLLGGDVVVVQRLLVLGPTLLRPGRVLRGGEDTAQSRGTLHCEVGLVGGCRWRTDGARIEPGVRRRSLENLEIQEVVDVERRRKDALQSLDLVLELRRLLRGLPSSVLRIHAFPELLVLDCSAGAGSGCPLRVPLGFGGGSCSPLPVPFGFPLDLHERGDDSAPTGHRSPPPTGSDRRRDACVQAASIDFVAIPGPRLSHETRPRGWFRPSQARPAPRGGSLERIHAGD